MWGPGIATVAILNILPYSYFLSTFFVFKRYNLLGFMPQYNRRTYYRQWWVRAFFGRTQYTVYSLLVFYMTIAYFNNRKSSNQLYYYFTSPLEEMDQYDQDENEVALEKSIQAKYFKMFETSRLKILDHRAKVAHDLKIEAFNEFADEYEKRI
jgi:hypothetical protein